MERPHKEGGFKSGRLRTGERVEGKCGRPQNLEKNAKLKTCLPVIITE